jgi:hypothetical protein
LDETRVLIKESKLADLKEALERVWATRWIGEIYVDADAQDRNSKIHKPSQRMRIRTRRMMPFHWRTRYPRVGSPEEENAQRRQICQGIRL